MSFVRVLSVMVMLAASVFSGGADSLARVCAMPHAAVMAHDCPCAQMQQRAHHAGRMELERASCCSIERSTSNPLPLATASIQPVTSVTAPPPALVMPLPVVSAPGVSVALRDVPRSQGPPVFLKVRSLLI